MERRQALLALMERLAPGLDKLADQVAMAVDKPIVYVRAHGRRLGERAISEPDSRLPQVAVLDALAEKKLLAEVDTGDAGEDVLAAVDKLASLPKKRSRFKALAARDDLEDLDADAVLRLATEVTVEQGFVLAALNTASDAYPVVAVPLADVDAIASLVKDAGFHALTVFRGAPVKSAKDAELKRKLTEQKALLDASVIVKNPAWQFFMSGEKYFNVKIATLVIDTSEGTLGRDDRATNARKFATWEETKAAADAMLAERRAAGYVEVSLEAYQKAKKEREKL